MLNTYFLFISSDKIDEISRNKERNTNTPHDVIFDVIKLNDAGKIACPLNAVQHIFIDSLSVSMLEWK